MLAGEKINLYLERVSTLIDEIAMLRNKTLSEYTLDSEHCPPSDKLKEQIANLYCMVMLKNELLNRVSNFLRIWKMDPQHNQEDIEEINNILKDFAIESKQDISFIKTMGDMGNLKKIVKLAVYNIYDNEGSLVETIELNEDLLISNE